MHYYKRNLGDYAKKAGRLSMLQHGAYTLLIDACYDREEFPTLEQAIEWTWASTTDEIEAVSFVLRKFFTLEDGVYVQSRIQEEIVEYQGRSETNKRIAIERETNRKAGRTNRAPHVNEPPPNHEPLTINQEPLNKNTSAVAPPVGVSDLVWADFCQHRKTKKAKLTQTAMAGIQSEADKAGWTLENALRECCARGWTGFKADWVKPDDRREGSRKPMETFLERDAAAGRKRWEEMTGRIHPGNQPKGEFIDTSSKILEIES